MKREDLPLIGFTLLVQLALGAVFAAAMLTLRLGSESVAAPLAGRLFWVALPALIAGLGLSLLHLGTPLGAIRALRNLGSSWLSREVLVTSLFTALTGVAAILQGTGRPYVNLLWLAGLTGFAAVFTMGRLYQATFRPAWTTPFTPVSFFTASLALGAAAGAVVVLGVSSASAIREILLHDMVLTGTVALAVQLTALTPWVAAYGRPTHALLDARLVAAAAGMIALAYGWHIMSLAAVWAGALALASGEALGRVLFFSYGEMQGFDTVAQNM